VVLWQKFGEEILDFDQVMRMGKSDLLFTGACWPGPGPAAAPVPSSFLFGVSFSLIIASNR
jgi:hypothetical protein